MKSRGKSIGALAAAILLSGAPALAQQMPFAGARIAAPAEPDAIPLYGEKTPGSAATEIWSNLPGQQSPSVRNVTRPTLTPVLPKRGTASGAAVVVAPGGAFVGLAYDLEGIRVARALADRGVAAFVLKYRVIPTPEKEAEMGPMVAQLMARGMSNPDKILDMQHGPATEDALQALAIVRDGAARWGIDPRRVGIIGFSAGAMTSLSSVLAGSADRRPDFVGYIYGPQATVAVPPGAPPLFAAMAADDPLFHTRGIPLVEAWQQAKRPVEFHLYQKGGHGFGLGLPGTTSALVLDEFTRWLSMQGFLRPVEAARGHRH